MTGGSYKLAVAGHDLGTLSNDAFAAVVGSVGALPRMTHLRATGKDDDTGATKTVETTDPGRDRRRQSDGVLGARLGRPAGDRAGRRRLDAKRARPPDRPSMCLQITFAERPKRPARFCNRYVSSSLFDPFSGPIGNPIAFNAAMDASLAFSIIDAYRGRPPHVATVRSDVRHPPR